MKEYRKIEADDKYTIQFNQSKEGEPNTVIIFPILRNCVIKVFEYEKRNGRIEVANKENKPIFAVNSLMQRSEIEITTVDEGEFELCAIQIDSACNKVFLSTKAKDYFEISDLETANTTFPKQNEDICVVHSSIKNAQAGIFFDPIPNKKSYLVFNDLNYGNNNSTVINNNLTAQKKYKEAAVFQWHTGSSEKFKKVEIQIQSEKSHDPIGYSYNFIKNKDDKSVILVTHSSTKPTNTEMPKEEKSKGHESKNIEEIVKNTRTKEQNKHSTYQKKTQTMQIITNTMTEAIENSNETNNSNIGFGFVFIFILVVFGIASGVIYMLMKKAEDRSAGIPLSSFDSNLTLDDAVNNLHAGDYNGFTPDPLNIQADEEEEDNECGFIALASGPIPLSGF